ncbi:MAG: hypothetical protein ACKOW5_02065, partial [Actinomycetales bacterium]
LSSGEDHVREQLAVLFEREHPSIPERRIALGPLRAVGGGEATSMGSPPGGGARSASFVGYGFAVTHSINQDEAPENEDFDFDV